MSWDEAIHRMDGTYYDQQVKDAANEYIAKNPEKFKCVVHDGGYQRWLKETQ